MKYLESKLGQPSKSLLRPCADDGKWPSSPRIAKFPKPKKKKLPVDSVVLKIKAQKKTEVSAVEWPSSL